MQDKIVRNFHDAYIKADHEGLKLLWKEETPKSLIKYYPAKYEQTDVNYFLDGISNNTLWLSSPSLFNDPFDGVINANYSAEALLSECIGKDIAKSLLSYSDLKELADNVAESLKEKNEGKHLYFENSLYMTCFTEKENLYSSRMWAHYANNHSGVCVEFDFASVSNISPFACIPVRYTDDYRYLLIPNNVSDDVTNFMRFFTKAKEWEYEKEWRVAQQGQLFMKGYNVPISSPIAVYLGCRVSEKLKNDVMATCENIPVYQMRMKPGTFQFYYDLIIRDPIFLDGKSDVTSILPKNTSQGEQQ